MKFNDNLFLKQNSILLFLVVLFTIPYGLKCQNIFDYENSLKYANYLQLAGDYKNAIQEYERLLFMNPDNDSLKLQVLKCHRLSGNNQATISKFDIYFSEPAMASKEFQIEYLKSLTLNNNYQIAVSALQNDLSLTKDEIEFFWIGNELLNGNYKTVKLKYDFNASKPSKHISYFQPIIYDYDKIKWKSPIAGGVMSAIVPGLGQTYAGNWKDGIFALLFTASTVYQSYRGFNEKGIKSGYGWIYGSLGCGFYLGNIYGSVKAANKYNFLKRQGLDYNIQNIISNF